MAREAELVCSLITHWQGNLLQVQPVQPYVEPVHQDSSGFFLLFQIFNKRSVPNSFVFNLVSVLELKLI